jgi:hypothetical protein
VGLTISRCKNKFVENLVQEAKVRLYCCDTTDDNSKAVPLHAMVALGGEEV